MLYMAGNGEQKKKKYKYLKTCKKGFGLLKKL